VGMAIDSLQDFEIAFKDIKLNKIGSGLTINAVASIMLAMYQSVAEKFGYKKEEISATPQNDILKEMVGRGAWIYPVEPAVRLIGDTIEYAMKELPRCNPVSVCGYHIRESGCTPVQEISYAFEIAFAYIDEVVRRDTRPRSAWGIHLQPQYLRQPLGNRGQVQSGQKALGQAPQGTIRRAGQEGSFSERHLRGRRLRHDQAAAGEQHHERRILCLAAALSGAQTTASAPLMKRTRSLQRGQRSFPSGPSRFSWTRSA